MYDRSDRRPGLSQPSAFLLLLATAFSLSPSQAQVCTVADQTQCQTANASGLTLMDRFNGPPYTVADDFIAETTSIDQVCWTVGFLPTAGNPPCHESPPADHFRFKIFDDLNGVPGVLLYDVFPVIVSDKQWHGGSSVLWDYSTQFDPPLSGFVPGERYWLELSATGNSQCAVYAALSLDGNGYRLSEYDSFSYNQEWTLEDRAPTPDDIAFCIGGTDSPATTIPPPLTGACCQCDGTCIDNLPLADCLGQQCTSPDCAALCPPEDPNPPCDIGPVISDGTFFPLQACSQIACNAVDLESVGETCANPEILPSGVCNEQVDVTFQTTCATTDGPTAYPNGCETGPASFVKDIWFEYNASCTGRVAIDLCGDVDYDATLAVYTNGTSRCPNVDEVTEQRTVCPPPLNDLVDHQCRNALCEYTGFFERSSYYLCALPRQCFLIRIGGNNDAGKGLLTVGTRHVDCFGSTTPSAEEIPDGVGGVTASIKNRVLSFKHNGGGRSEALRVTFVNLPGPWAIYNGRSLWVGPPVEYDELPGVGYNKPCDSNCQAGTDDCSPCVGNTFFSSELQCDPFYTDWSVYDTVHIRDERIVPSTFVPGGGGFTEQAVYQIRSVWECACVYGEDDFVYFGPPLELSGAGWGDIAELYDGQYIAPDDVVSLADLLAVIQSFVGEPDNGHLLNKVRVDLVGVSSSGVSPVVDGVISISDVVEVLAAFSGGGYGFNPGPWPCP